MKVVFPSSFYIMNNKQREKELAYWEKVTSCFPLSTIVRDEILAYAKRLINNNTAVIFSLSHLALLLGIKVATLKGLINATSSYYYSFKIPKKSGGYREISAPYPVLLSVQKWIYNNILNKIKLNDHAKGFIKRMSIKDNASMHLNTSRVLKMDIKNFFPSIRLNRVMSVFLNLGYTNKIAYYLSALCCLNERLPQGAATSPCLSNIIAKRLDARLTGLSTMLSLNYTRYADDLTFSGDILPPKFIKYVTKIVKEEGFIINRSKTHLISKGCQKIITGISISSGVLKIPREKRREVRKDIYYLLKNGIFEHLKHKQSFDPIYVERLLGFLFFWKSIEPNNSFVISSIQKLKKYAEQLDSTTFSVS